MASAGSGVGVGLASAARSAPKLRPPQAAVALGWRSRVRGDSVPGLGGPGSGPRYWPNIRSRAESPNLDAPSPRVIGQIPPAGWFWPPSDALERRSRAWPLTFNHRGCCLATTCHHTGARRTVAPDDCPALGDCVPRDPRGRRRPAAARSRGIRRASARLCRRVSRCLCRTDRRRRDRVVRPVDRSRGDGRADRTSRIATGLRTGGDGAHRKLRPVPAGCALNLRACKKRPGSSKEPGRRSEGLRVRSRRGLSGFDR